VTRHALLRDDAPRPAFVKGAPLFATSLIAASQVDSLESFAALLWLAAFALFGVALTLEARRLTKVPTQCSESSAAA